MLSILIPTYNYNVLPLAEIIEQQALKAGIVFELICMDDGSFSEHNKKNQQINTLANCKFIENKKNVGSKANRQRLAELAQYDWLLFIDADSKPKSPEYLSNYIKEISSSNDAVFGGIAYNDISVDSSKVLRYRFGKEREEVDANIRNKKPYKVIASANYLIKRSVFLGISSWKDMNIYGLDYLFSTQLKEKSIKVKHINNEVFHLGLDTNDAFLKKTKNAVKALHSVINSGLIKTHSIGLLNAYTIVKFVGLRKPLAWLFKKTENRIENNLKGESPNLFLFDTYRLGYFCTLSSQS
ncbi:MAG: glycosyltransferase [Flavobacteriaceae bacterium]